MAIRTIDPFGGFLNQIKQQNTLLKETMDEWDAIMNTGLAMVKDLDKLCEHPEAKPILLFLREAFSSGQGLTFLISNRFAIIKDIAEVSRHRSHYA